MKERLFKLRKELDLSMDEFGKRIGVTRSTISRLEAGSNNFTEQMIKSICREFNVDYAWFTVGTGEMFCDSESDTLALIDQVMTGESEFHKNLFKTFSKFDEEDLKALEKMLNKFVDVKNNR